MPTMAELLESMKAKRLVSEAAARPVILTNPTPEPENFRLHAPRHEPDSSNPIEYHQGWNAGFHGLSTDDVPYSIDSDEYGDWLEGHQAYFFHQQDIQEAEYDEEDRMMENDSQSTDSSVVSVDVINEDALVSQASEIILNDLQMEAYNLALSGKSFCEIGAAGTGKTTSMKKITKDIIDKGHIPLLTESTKHLRVGHPGIAVISFTNKAVNNIRRSVDPRIKVHTLTAHKLLEFRPVKYEIEDEATGKARLTMKFEPSRTFENPLPKGLKLIIWEESSMLGTSLYNMVRAACPHGIQEIFLGDIQQLPPVFGSAVLGFKMNELPVVELKEVYRQALESPIIRLAWKILEGNPHDFSAKVERYKDEKGNPRIRCPSLEAMNSADEHGSLEFRIWQKVTDETKALMATQFMFKNWYLEGKYNPYKDIILCPYNMKYGTIEINKLLAQYFSIQRNEPVHEIIAGFEKVYYAVGDRVLVGKEDAFIESIEPNPAYLGKTTYCVPSVYLDRWGIQQTPVSADEVLQHKVDQGIKDEEQAEYFLEGDGSIDDIDGDTRVNAASHIVTCRFSYSDEMVVLKSAGELKHPNFLGGYCLTVHKFQGSEEEKVFILLHQMHNKMVRRELLYTAVTRARKHLVIICENTSFEKGVAKQAIKGDTIAEKAEVFKGKLEEIKNDDDIPVLSRNLDIDLEECESAVDSNYLQDLPAQPLQPKEQIVSTRSSSIPERPMTMKEKLQAMRDRLKERKG